MKSIILFLGGTILLIGFVLADNDVIASVPGNEQITTIGIGAIILLTMALASLFGRKN